MGPEDRSQVATSAAVRRIADEFGFLTAEEVARNAGLTSVKEVNLSTADGGLLHMVADSGQRGYPSFLFNTVDGLPSPTFVALAGIAKRHHCSHQDAILWLCTETGRLGDRRPIDLILDQDFDDDMVLTAAEQSFSVEW